MSTKSRTWSFPFSFIREGVRGRFEVTNIFTVSIRFYKLLSIIHSIQKIALMPSILEMLISGKEIIPILSYPDWIRPSFCKYACSNDFTCWEGGGIPELNLYITITYLIFCVKFSPFSSVLSGIFFKKVTFFTICISFICCYLLIQQFYNSVDYNYNNKW